MGMVWCDCLYHVADNHLENCALTNSVRISYFFRAGLPTVINMYPSKAVSGVNFTYLNPSFPLNKWMYITTDRIKQNSCRPSSRKNEFQKALPRKKNKKKKNEFLRGFREEKEKKNFISDFSSAPRRSLMVGALYVLGTNDILKNAVGLGGIYTRC